MIIRYRYCRSWRTPYSQEYLSLLARKGRLEAIKRGRVWLTTPRAVEEYRLSVESKNP